MSNNDNPDWDEYLKRYDELLASIVTLHNSNQLLKKNPNKDAGFNVRRNIRKVMNDANQARRSLIVAMKVHEENIKKQGIVKYNTGKKLSVNEKTRIRATFRKLSSERAAYKIK